ncbi:MAG: ABC transporter permease [Bdellovibrionaceae bacterium]|nr:ABC transporter permease [Pseudobdellovibrionaceae bacterium]
MPKKDLLITPFLFFFYRDVSRVFKVKVQTIFAPLISQTLYLIIFGVSLGRIVTISNQFSYLEFIIPGLVAMSLINQSFQNGSSSIFSMKITGEIIDIKSTALNVQQIIFAIAFSGLLRGLIVSGFTLVIGQLFHFLFEGSFLPLHSILSLIGFLSLGGLVFSTLGFSVGIWSKTFDHIGAISSFIILPLIYLGGVFFDLDTLSPFWQKVSVINPLLYFVNGIRYSFLGVSDVPISQAFLIVFSSLFISYIIAYLMAFKGSFQRAF